ncbi:MAG TPA: heavy-metal-associated domain-containing protein [Candidatus Thermoplasmatota archaeon]|nr:heavy-metal-associated domain-containing protein [Candidatus Thermoplasmatota archaeon]
MTSQNQTSSESAIEIGVTGMTCGHCVGTVKAALQAVPGVGDVRVDLRRGTAKVAPAPGAVLDRGTLVDAIETAGYGTLEA